MFVSLKNACHVLLQPFFPFIANERCPVLYSKNKLNMNLRISIWHTINITIYNFTQKHQSFLTERFSLLSSFFYPPNVPAEQVIVDRYKVYLKIRINLWLDDIARQRYLTVISFSPVCFKYFFHTSPATFRPRIKPSILSA